MQDTIGVDVSKAVLDAYCSLRGEHRQFPNDASEFVRWAPGGNTVIVFEASGAYHRDLERMLSRRGLTFAKVNPRQARKFAEAIGRVAKTARIPSRDIVALCTAGQWTPRCWSGWG